jgi:hypothetical protein
MPFCLGGTCVECLEDGDCGVASPTCSPSGTCV